MLLEGEVCVQYQSLSALRLVNDIRRDVDARPVVFSNPLSWACQCYANGLDDLEIIEPFYNYASVSGYEGEVAVLTALALDLEGALESWLRSASHRAALLGDADVLGFGRAGIAWVLAMGRVNRKQSN